MLTCKVANDSRAIGGRNAHGPASRSNQPCEEPQQRGLAGTIRTDQPHDLAWANREGDVADHGVAAVRFGDVLELAPKHHAGSFSGASKRTIIQMPERSTTAAAVHTPSNTAGST